MNYYGPGGSFLSVSYDRALAPNGVPPDFFRDRIVFVGGRSTLDALMLGKDDFRNPFSWLSAEFSKGVEVHLTALLNLLRSEWLNRLDPRRELWLALGIGVLLGTVLPLFRPHDAALLAACFIGGIGLFAYWLFHQHHIWFAWCISAFVQAPLALGWAVGARYFLEERRRNALREAFIHYLSPHMADRIADADFSLEPGGVVVEATVMFTDLAGFSALSERLDNPAPLAQILTRYFTETTGHVLDNDGTIIKFIGDAVMAVWGAPLPDKDHVQGRARRLAAARGNDC
jgi:adenylate cyclase